MKKYLFGAALSLGILVAPAFTQAAALTTAQSTSLIAVVQSSPGVPASAFVNLITSFSNITVNQATSLIAVVQSAPGASPSAFVNLLISFTADTSTTQPATPATNQAVTPTTTQSTAAATSAMTTTQPTATTAPYPSLRVNTWILAARYKQLLPKGLHGLTDCWMDGIVVDPSGQSAARGTNITCSIDGIVFASSTGAMPQDYWLPLDTTKYSNGTHQLTISANDVNGNTASGTLEIDIEN